MTIEALLCLSNQAPPEAAPRLPEEAEAKAQREEKVWVDTAMKHTELVPPR